MDVCTNKYIALLLLPGGKLCFVTFLAISTWFLVEQPFKMERYLKTWGQVFFYSLVFAAVSVKLGAVLNIRNWISVCFPIIGNSHGFAATYLAFYLCIPFLGMISDRLTKKQLQWLTALLFYFQVISRIVGAIGGYYTPICSELLLFVLCYFGMLYFKRYPIKILSNKFFLFCVVLGTWLLTFIIQCLAMIVFTGSELVGLLRCLCTDESSILYLLGGYALFFLFNCIQIPTSKIVNAIAKGTFGILLIHDHQFFRYVLWNNIFQSSEWWYSSHFLLRVFISTISIFICGLFIDIVRQKLIEKPLFSLMIVKKFSNKIDEVLRASLGDDDNGEKAK